MNSNKKIVFTGPVGVGKTTAVRLLGGKNVISTDEKASDMTLDKKETTTVAMDYGLMSLSNGEKIRIYGTPGQERFDFMWDIITLNSDGLVLLLDNSRSNPLKDLRFFISKFKEYATQGKFVVGITKNDIKRTLGLDQYHEELKKLGARASVHMVDARKHGDVMKLINALTLTPGNPFDGLSDPETVTSSIRWL